MVYFFWSVELLLVVKNPGHVLEHKPVKKAAVSLLSRTTQWLRRKSQMFYLRKTEQLRTRQARFRRLIVFSRNPFKENTAHLKFNPKSKALLCAKPLKIVRILSMCTQNCDRAQYIIRVEELNLRTEKKICPPWLRFDCRCLRAADCLYTNFDSFHIHYGKCKYRF